MQLRFASPILLPAKLEVTGNLIADGDPGQVEVVVADAVTGTKYVNASYQFSRHRKVAAKEKASSEAARAASAEPAPYLVTGASGALGDAVLKALGSCAVGVSRRPDDSFLAFGNIRQSLEGRRIRGIIHCGWPAPDNQRLTALPQVAAAVEYNLAAPVRDVISLAQLLHEAGEPGAILVLVGSTASAPGRHNYRMPLYTLAKSLVAPLAQILAVELAAARMRCAALVYDVIDGGMNKNLSPTARLAHEDRAPSGHLPDPAEAAAQIVWLLNNQSHLVSGASICVSGGAMP